MVKSKLMLSFAVFLLLIVMIVNFPFPHENPYGESLTSVFEIPLTTVNGFQILGVITFILLIMSLVLFWKSVEKFKVRIVVIALLVSISLPNSLVSGYQKTFASDIYAVTYDRKESTCMVEKKNDSSLHSECEFTFMNFSKEEVKFDIIFYEKYHSEEFAALVNDLEPYEVKLPANEQTTVKMEMEIPVDKTKPPIDSMSANGVSIILKSKTATRNL